MKQLLMGLVKGLVIGLVIGFLFAVLDTGLHTRDTKLAMFAVVGAVAGLVCGTPVWKGEALARNGIKAAVGIGAGLLVMAFLYYVVDFRLGSGLLTSHYALVSSIWGALYGAFVEWDDRR